MTVNRYLWVWAAPEFMVQLNGVIKLSPAARLPGSLSGKAEDTETAPLVSVLNTDTQIYTVCLNGWWRGCLFLWSYLVFTWTFWDASSLSESPAGVWTRWGKCSPVCCCAQSYRNFPFEEQGFSRLPLSTPEVFGGQGLKPGDEWHEVTHAPNPKHLLWKTDFSSSPSSFKVLYCTTF